jgi:hypothetical protein
MNNSSLPLITFIHQPKSIENWTPCLWDQFLQQAYNTGLLARVFSILTEHDLFESVPEHLKWHFNSANIVYLAHKQDVLLEVEYIEKALKPAGITPVFLKGAAYLLNEAKCSDGRLFADVDIFVAKKDLASTEELLRWNGWVGKKVDEHDEKYYRDWMHEIPPMTNTRSGMTVDVHHNLVPLVSRMSLNSEEILANVVVNEKGIKTLSAEDKVLHSASHLLLDGEFNHGFRDLHDIYLLIVEYSMEDPLFLSRLQKRSLFLGFELIFYYCLKLQQHFFSLSVEEQLLEECEKRFKSKFIKNSVLKAMIKVLTPDVYKHRSTSFNTALFILFIRSHWLKMPMHILIPHLIYKSLISPIKQRKLDKVNNENA